MATKGAEVRLYGSISLIECLDVVVSRAKRSLKTGKPATTVIVGPTGTGKTHYTVERLQAEFPKHTIALGDMSCKEAGDLTMPKFTVMDGVDVVVGVPHADLGLHADKPMIMILDEILKTKKANLVALASLIYEHKFAGRNLHPESFIVGLSNLAGEGFNDASLAFFDRRVKFLECRKFTADEWIDGYAIPKGLHLSIIASAREYPSMFADYRDYTKPGENQYIFDPRVSTTTAFVCGGTLEAASEDLYALEGRPKDVITHSLIGIVGPRAAMDIMGVHELHDQLPDWKDIIAKPETAKIPDSAGALVLLVYKAIQELQAKQVEPWMIYLKRMKKEAQALFASTILKIPSKAPTVSSNTAFIDWATKNKYLYQAV